MTDTKKDSSEKEPIKVAFSVPQIAGGALAAATAAAIGSKLGVAGTVIGAAVASLVGGVAGTLYSAGIDRTHRKVTAAIAKGSRTSTDQAATPDSTRVMNTDTPNGEPTLLLDDTVFRDAVEPQTAPTPEPKQRGRRPVVVAAITAAAIFVVALVVITVYELSTGKALDGGSGTTISQGVKAEEKKASSSKPTASSSATSSKPTTTQATSSSTTTSTKPTSSATTSSSASQSPTATTTTSTESAAPAEPVASPTAAPTSTKG